MCSKWFLFVVVYILGTEIRVFGSEVQQTKRQIIQSLEAPRYFYDPTDLQYIPPAEGIDIPVPSTTRPATSTTRRPQTISTTTEFFLPEIIVNRDTGNIGNSAFVAKLTTGNWQFNGYPESVRPYPSFDPVSTSPTLSDPPLTILSEDEPTNQYLPPTQQPQQDEVPSNQYLPPPTFPRILPKSSRNLFRNQRPLTPLRLELNQLRCLDSPDVGYFQALLNIQGDSVDIPPIVLVNGEPSAETCGIRMVRSRILVNIRSDSFQRCGIEPCGGGTDNHQLCLSLTFPQINGMTTAADGVLTLQCKVQEKIISQTHSLQVGVSKDSIARSIGTFAQGGSQQPYRTQISLFQAGASGLNSNSPLAPGSTVRLGQELVLRAQVRPGDGWNYTRISDVYLQRLSPSGDILNSANLITSAGCVHPTMRSVVPVQPVFDPPLGHRLAFRAVMFQGMRSGDEMVISVKVLGCIHNNDCFVDSAKCDRLSIARNRRQIEDVPMPPDLPSDVARLSFRVDMLDPAQYRTVLADGQPIPIHSVGIIGVVATVSLLLLALIIGLYVRKRQAARSTFDGW